MKNLTRYTFLILFFVLTTSFSLPPPQERTTEFVTNGLKVILKPSVKEIMSVRFFIKGGTANYSKELEGVESLALSVAVEGGTKKMGKTEFATALEKIGTSIGSSTSYDYSEINMSYIKEFCDQSRHKPLRRRNSRSLIQTNTFGTAAWKQLLPIIITPNGPVVQRLAWRRCRWKMSHRIFAILSEHGIAFSLSSGILQKKI